jgi:crossover junction endodeoxyribonuclease RusA
MQKPTTITLLGKPESTNTLYRRRGHTIYMSKEGRDLKMSYSLQARMQWKYPMILDDVIVTIALYFGDKRRRDIDNWHKILLDSLTGIVWKDDSQIQEMRVTKNIGKPRIELTVN